MACISWKEKGVDEKKVAELERAGCAKLAARVLAIRGVSPSGLRRFLDPSIKLDFPPPESLPGVSVAAARIFSEIEDGGKIAVFGDYDCDGICATAILCRAILACGGNAVPFIPRRLEEGYGMTDASVGRLFDAHPDVKLVVTVDNGVNSVEMVGRLAARGVDMIVTDHHLPGATLPRCTVVNPKVASGEGEEWLCAAGVALLVANAVAKLARAAGRDTGSISAPLFVLAGIATVTDLMPLTGLNRLLVVEALRLFERHAPPGLKELFERAARTGTARLAARDFGFVIGPRINASGRMGSAMDAYSLVSEDEREAAREWARKVDMANVERRSVESAMTEEAMSKIEPEAAAQTIDLAGAHSGVAGIVASRVMDRLADSAADATGAVPVCIVVDGRGSARAPYGYNVRDALEGCGDFLERCGGHAAAAGFTVKPGCLEDFKRRFAAECAAQKAALPAESREKPVIDAWISWNECTLGLAQEMERFAPFGEGNEEPVFAIRRTMISSARRFGSDSQHLQLSFAGGARPRAVWWNAGAKALDLHSAASVPHDIMFNLVVSEYGSKHVELKIVDIRKSL